jgi:phosphohistidine phosphatase
MRVLHLVRHAKSSWDDPDLGDRDRPLTPRGKRASKALAHHLEEAGIRPDIVVCSPARRAQDTLKPLQRALGAGATVRLDERVYAASADELLDVVSEVPDRVSSVMLVGHNPGLQDLALALIKPGASQGELVSRFPTGALASLAIPGSSWHRLRRGSATLTELWTPRPAPGP